MFQDSESDRLPLLSIHNKWVIWYTIECTLVVMRPSYHDLEIDMYFLLEFELFLNVIIQVRFVLLPK